MNHHRPILLATCLLLHVVSISLSAAKMSDVFTPEEIASSVGMKQLTAPPEPVSQDPVKLSRELQHESGTVKVGFLVNEKGEVLAPRVADSTNERLNEHALESVKNWKFKPGEKDGQPVVTRLVAPVKYDGK